LRLLTGIAGRRAVERADLRIDAHHPEAMTAVSHMRHVAAAYGVAIDRQEKGNGAGVWLMRDAAYLDRLALRSALEDWLTDIAVPRFGVPHSPIKRNREGRASFAAGDDKVEVAHLILADDEAVLAHTDSKVTASLFRTNLATSLLTEPAERLHQPITLCADDGTVARRLRNGCIACLLPVPSNDALELAGRRIGIHASVRVAGLAEFDRLTTFDGAMSVGVVPRSQVTMIAGADPFAAFLAPALARFLAGEASEAESVYFTARVPSRRVRIGVAEFDGVTLSGAAA
jgi:hypothetical protein